MAVVLTIVATPERTRLLPVTSRITRNKVERRDSSLITEVFIRSDLELDNG